MFIKQADFVDQYRKGKVPASTLIKMAAFKDELEKAFDAGRFDELVKTAVLMPLEVNGLGEAAKAAIFPQFAAKTPNIFARLISAVKGTGRFGNNVMGDMAAGALGKDKTNQINHLLIGGLVVGGAMSAFHEIVKTLEGKIIDWSNDRKKPGLFSEMLSLHPALLEEDRARVEQYYEALWHFSPVMAENPIAAGSYIEQALKYHHVSAGPLPNSINELTMIQKNWNQGMKDESSSTMSNIMNPFRLGFEDLGKHK